MAVFRGEQPDVMPWFADLTYWYSAMEYRHQLPEKYSGESGKIKLYRDLGCGAHEELYNLPGELSYNDIKISYSSERHKDGTIIYEEEYTSQRGSIVAIRKFMPSSVSIAYLKYPVSTRQDLKVLQDIFKNQEFKPNYALQYDRLERWKGLGLVSSLPPRTPLQQIVVVWAGLVNTVKLLMREREEVDETVQVMSEADDPIYEAICRSPAPAVYFGENLTSEAITPAMFKRYHAPYYERRAAQLHAAGKYIFVHIDGTLRGILPLMGKTGVDCAQSVTPAPIGDVEVKRLREVAGPDIILWGGLPGVCFSPQYPEKMLCDMAREVIRYHKQGHKFIIGIADQVPADGEISRVKMITDIVEKEAKY
ncbi:MAG: uroporphyrinogen decarboxylase family protein [Thermoproteota archaeon]